MFANGCEKYWRVYGRSFFFFAEMCIDKECVDEDHIKKLRLHLNDSKTEALLKV